MQRFVIFLTVLFFLLSIPVFSQSQYLNFAITVNGEIDRDANGLYFLIFNYNPTQYINVTDNRTFTDFISYNGISAVWYHRRTDPINTNLFVWEQAGTVNNNLYISSDRKKLIFMFNIDDTSNFLTQYLVSPMFNAHCVTTDTTSCLKFDTIGKGPDINNNSIYTLRVNKYAGAVPPFTEYYPIDPEGDTVKFEQMPDDFPYENFDIVNFEVYKG
jgi:hypothetical protein